MKNVFNTPAKELTWTPNISLSSLSPSYSQSSSSSLFLIIRIHAKLFYRPPNHILHENHFDSSIRHKRHSSEAQAWMSFSLLIFYSLLMERSQYQYTMQNIHDWSLHSSLQIKRMLYLQIIPFVRISCSFNHGLWTQMINDQHQWWRRDDLVLSSITCSHHIHRYYPSSNQHYIEVFCYSTWHNVYW